MTALLTQTLAACKSADRGFNPRTSSLKLLLEMIGKPVCSADNVQAALEAIPADKAKKYRAALMAVINAFPGTFYVGVRSFDTRGTPSSVVEVGQGMVRYTSALFFARADIYCIIPDRMGARVGFIQHCTSKDYAANFSGGHQQKFGSLLSFPIGDAGSLPPFYWHAVSSGCTEPCVKTVRSTDGDLKLEVSDSFDRNGFQYHPRKNATELVAGSWIESIRRNQSFTLWLGLVTPQLTRLFRQLSYTIDVDVQVRIANNTISATNRSTCRIDPVRMPSRFDRLPPVSAPNMNHAEFEQYKAPNGNWVRLG